MSKKTPDSSSNNGFDDFEESFFSKPVAVSPSSTKNDAKKKVITTDIDDEDSDDFGYSGPIDDMAMETVDDSTNAFLLAKAEKQRQERQMDAPILTDDETWFSDDESDKKLDQQLDTVPEFSVIRKDHTAEPSPTEEPIPFDEDISFGEPLENSPTTPIEIRIQKAEQSDQSESLPEDVQTEVLFGDDSLFQENMNFEDYDPLEESSDDVTQDIGQELLNQMNNMENSSSESVQIDTLVTEPNTSSTQKGYDSLLDDVHLFGDDVDTTNSSLDMSENWSIDQDLLQAVQDAQDEISHERGDASAQSEHDMSYEPPTDDEYFKIMRGFLDKETSLLSEVSDKGFLWTENARISHKFLRDTSKATEYYELALQSDMLRNDDIRLYADLVAKENIVGKFVNLLEKWALGRTGALSAEAWSDIAIFLRKRLNKNDLALESVLRAISSDNEDWLSLQLLCQIQESLQDWNGLAQTLSDMQQLTSGALASQLAVQQGMVAFNKLQHVDMAFTKLAEAMNNDVNFQAAIILLQLASRYDNVEYQEQALQYIIDNLANGNDKLLWMLYKQRIMNSSADLFGDTIQSWSTDSVQAFWLRVSLIAKEDVAKKIALLEEGTQSDRDDLALIWFHLAMLYKEQSSEQYAEALLQTISIDPYAIIAVDHYVEYLIQDKQYEECVDWLRQLSETVRGEEPDVSLAYLSQAAFIADVYLGDPINAAQMLSSSAIEETGLAYLAETLYLRGEHWEALIYFYQQRADETADASEAAHWLIQAGRIAETRLGLVNEAEELYAAARERSDVAKIGVTDILRLRIKTGEWREVVSLIGEHADNAIEPAGMYYMAANVADCLLQDRDLTLLNISKCLQHDPNHIAALLLLRKIAKTPEQLVSANKQLLLTIQNRDMNNWLQWEMSNHAKLEDLDFSFSENSIFYIERLFSRLTDTTLDKNGLASDLWGQNPLVDILLLAHMSASDVQQYLSKSPMQGLGFALFAEMTGDAGLALKLIPDETKVLREYEQDTDSVAGVNVQMYRSRLLEQFGQIPAARKTLASVQTKMSACSFAVRMEKLLRKENNMHEELASIHAVLAQELPDPSPASYYALLAGQLYSHLGNVDKATKLYKQAFSYRPVLGKIFQGLKSLYIQTHNVSAMEELLTNLEQLTLLDYAEIMEEFREYAKAAEAYKKIVYSGDHVSKIQLLPYLIRMERCFEKTGDWQSVMQAIQKQIDMVSSLEFQQYLESKLQWVLVEHLADSDIALDTYQQMLEQNPNNREVLRALARISIQHDQVDKAIQYLEDLSKQPMDEKDAIQIQKTLAEAYQAQGNIDKELETLNSIVDLDPNNIDAIDALGDCYRQIGNWNDLVSLLHRKSNLCNTYEKVLCRKEIAVIAEERLQNADLAMKEWNVIYELSGPDEDILRHLTKLSQKQGDIASYLHYAEELVGLLHGIVKAELCLEIADTYAHDLMEESKAIPYLEMVITEDKTFMQAVDRLEAFYMLMGEWDKLFALLVEKQKHVKGVKSKVAVLLKAAEIADTSLRNVVAVDDIFAQILELDPSNMQALIRRSEQLYVAKQWSDLVDLYTTYEKVFLGSEQKSFELQQEQLKFYCRFAEALVAVDEEEKSLAKLRKALLINPSHIPSLQLMGAGLVKFQQWKEAYEVYQKLLVLVDGQQSRDVLWDCYIQLGSCAFHIKEYDKAIGYYQKARLYDDKNTSALRGIIECWWEKGDYTRVAQLCANLVKQATTTDDVIFGYQLRGYILDSKLQKQDLAEQHYVCVLEYERDHPTVLLYLAEISLRKGQLDAAKGQLEQGWPHAKDTSLGWLYALGRIVISDLTGEKSVAKAMRDYLATVSKDIADDVQHQFVENLRQRL